MIQDFIGVFDGVYTQEECQTFINFFEKMNNLNLTYDRQSIGDGKAHQKKDETAFLMEYDLLMRPDHPLSEPFMDKFWQCYNQYADVYSILRDADIHSIASMRIQKTLPSGGYHVWHYENSSNINKGRVTAFTLYLNDVEIGGETEYLYQSKRVEAKQGRLVIWPAGFTHTHRGNPPLKGIKYILTGWLEYSRK
jgi:hypothetical protein